MAHEAEISIERAARVRIGRPGTVRDQNRLVVDVPIEDLSTTGCMFRGNFAIEIGTLITIGVTGIGMHVARVSRLIDGGAGCAFLLPLSEEALETATVAQTVQPGGFLQMKTGIRTTAAVEHNRSAEDRDQSLRTRFRRAFAIICGER